MLAFPLHMLAPLSADWLTCPICEFAGERGTDMDDVIEPTGEALPVYRKGMPARRAAEPAEVMDAVSSVACERVRDSLLGSPFRVATGRPTFSTLVRGANKPHLGGHWKYLK